MPDWRGKDDDDYADEKQSNRRQHRARRGHGRGSRDFGESDEFGGPEDFGAPPVYTGDFGRGQDFNSGQRANTTSRADSRSGYGGGYSGNREGGGNSDARPRSPSPSTGGNPAEQAEYGPRQLGTVKFFKDDKGFGFITPDNGDADIFVHISAVERSGLTGLANGQRVSFQTEADRRGKGPKAVELQEVDNEQA